MIFFQPSSAGSSLSLFLRFWKKPWAYMALGFFAALMETPVA